MQLELERLCTVTNVNLRKEMHGDETCLALDLDFTAVLPWPEFSTTFSNLPDMKALGSDVYVDSVGLKLDFEGHGMKIGALSYIDVRIKKFKLTEFSEDSVKVKFQAQLYPNHDHVNNFAEMIGDDVALTISKPAQQELEDVA